MEIRRITTLAEEIFSEAGQCSESSLRKIAVVAVLKNPFAGRYEKNLQSLTDASAEIGRKMAAIGVAAMNGRPIESYGKAGVVGINGEQEHAVAMLTTVFGNVIRDAAGGGKAWISSMTKRAAAGAVIDLPLAHKDALYVRSHYDGITVMLNDAPLADEIALIVGYASGGRLNHRVGGLTKSEIKGEDGLV